MPKKNEDWIHRKDAENAEEPRTQNGLPNLLLNIQTADFKGIVLNKVPPGFDFFTH